MAANPTAGQVQALMMRVARLDNDGVPLPGASSLYVTDSFVSLKFQEVYEDGEDIRQKNARGVVCSAFRGPDSLVRGDVELALCSPDARLEEMLSDGTVLTGTGVDSGTIGWSAPPIGRLENAGLSIEVWTYRVISGEVATDGYPYTRWVYPRVKNLRRNGHVHENGVLAPSYKGQAFENPNWYNGPLNDWSLASDRWVQWFPTRTLPASTAGAYATLAAS